MSGGLDSTTLAALAREVAPHVNLLAITSVYRSRIDDVEERYAVEAARSIGIEQRSFVLDDYHPLQSLDEGLWTADPGALLTAAMSRDVHAEAVRHAPIAMHGHPADALFAVDLKAHLKSLGTLQLVAALIRYTLARRRLPYFFFRRQRAGAGEAPRPRWLLARGYEERAVHPLGSAAWSSYFEWAHPAVTGSPIELVYPWFDERVVEAALALEPVPWLVDKYVVRRLLRGRVSETIRTRRKTYLRGDPWRVTLPVQRSLEIEAAVRFIDPVRFREALRGDRTLSDRALRAVAFEYWLRELPRRVERLRRTIRA
jgi:asparagine synthetase B (glutamine-hydrolysing)